MDEREGRVNLRRWLSAYVLAVTCAAVVAAAVAIAVGERSTDVALISFLIVGGVLAERFKVEITAESHVSLSVALCGIAAVTGGALAAVLVAGALALAVNANGRIALHKALFNVAVYVLSTLAFLATFSWASSLGLGGDWPGSIAPITLAALADLAVNGALVAAAISVETRTRWLTIVRQQCVGLVPHYLLLGALIAGTAAAYESEGSGALLLFAGAAAAMQRILRRYEWLWALQQAVDQRVAATQAEAAGRASREPHAA